LRMVALSADGLELFLFNELTGVFSVMTLASREERALLEYTGPAVRGMSLDPGSGRTIMVEGNGNCLLFDGRAANVISNFRIEATADRRQATGGEAIGAINTTDGPLEREFASDAEVLQAEEEHSRKADLFSAAPRGEDERRVATELAKAEERIEALVEQTDFAGQVELLSHLLRDFEGRDYFSVAGSNRFRTSIGAAFAQRGEAHRGLGDHEAAARDFTTAIDYHYYSAYLSRIEQLTFELGDFEAALALIDEVLVHFDAKSSIGLRKSTPLYRARVACLLELGRIDDGYRVLTDVLESLVAYLEGEAQSEDLAPIHEDLARLANTSDAARQLAQWFNDVLERFPTKVPKDEERRAQRAPHRGRAVRVRAVPRSRRACV
jgi:tetratricopeptide (TPR) repeat protein